ncbi:MAG: hypothetical protein K6B46_01175 [Opitutales bacterium]|nr:hypothetical protein [Opitutales bacterium]
MIEFEETPEFRKDFKSLLKRYRTLEDDFEIMKRFTLIPFFEKGIVSSALLFIEGFCDEKYKSVKIKKFSCRALKGRGAASGIRVICVWQKAKCKISFIQIYMKSDFENEDRSRLKRFVETL